MHNLIGNNMKSIITSLLLFIVIFSFGQSKEETQEWIAQQIYSYSFKDAASNNTYKLRYENDQIIINNLFKRTLPNSEESYVITYYIPINDLLSIRFDENKHNTWMIIKTKSGEKTIKYIPPFIVKKKRNGHTMMYELPESKMRFFSQIEILLSKTISEDNLKTRLIKSFDHLMSFYN